LYLLEGNISLKIKAENFDIFPSVTAVSTDDGLSFDRFGQIGFG
jgi:hypothetical protein